MLEWNPSLLATPLLGGLVIILACSGNADRVPADTAASTTVSGTMTDTAGSAAAASSAPAPGESARVDTAAVRAQQSAVVQPPSQEKIRPSIDPGRKAPPAKPATTPAPTAAPAPSAEAGAQGSPLKYDAASNTVTFELIGGPTGFQFNGHASGSATLTVPPKANIVMNFVNKDGTPHSAEIISGEGALPNAAVDAALPRAYTNKVLEGLPQEGGDVMRFQVPESGTYRIFCGVPGHGLSGMWIWLKVDPAAKTPSFGPTKT